MDNYLGKHILIEFWECEKSVLDNVNEIENLMLEAAKKAKVTIVEKCFHKFSPYGVSGVVVIAESHLAIHTWPEYNYAAVDFFTCNKNCNIEIAIEYLKEKFNSKKHSVNIIKRGNLEEYNSKG